MSPCLGDISWLEGETECHNLVGCAQSWRQVHGGKHSSAWGIREGFLEEVTPELSLRK